MYGKGYGASMLSQPALPLSVALHFTYLGASFLSVSWLGLSVQISMNFDYTSVHEA